MKPMILGIALALGASSVASAQAYNPDRELGHFTRSALKATLAEMGATTTDRDGQPNITVEFANGVKADAVLMACDDPDTSNNCLATSILATFSPPSDGNNATVREAINRYNQTQNFGRAYLSDTGTITLRTYIIADGGVSMSNYRSQMLLFAVSAKKFSEYLYRDS